jgi:hypothetical protein
MIQSDLHLTNINHTKDMTQYFLIDKHHTIYDRMKRKDKI